MSKSKKSDIELIRNNELTEDFDKLQIIALGGWREIGKNICVLRYQDDLMIIDSGLGFPADEMLGIDLVIPDFSFVKHNRDKVRGIFLTHGHEDHIGAITWLMQNVDCPVYGLPLTMKLVKEKLFDRQRGSNRAFADENVDRLNIVKTGETIRAGKFKVEFVHVNHSIADASGIYVQSPAGSVYHSGDFKLDWDPVHGDPIDLNRLAEIGSSGLTAYIGESTNVEHPGFTPSESMVGESLGKLFADVDGRIFVATFASNVFRLQQIIEAAELHNRKVGLLGFSMRKVFEAANSLGYLKYKPETMVDLDDLLKLKPEEILIIMTGTQGEPMAALSRIAHNEHRQVEIQAGDTVFLSSSMIPGNESAIYSMINDLYLCGAEVIYHRLADIHVSGHAYRGELQLILNLLKPKYFVPNHGEFRHMYKHGQLAKETGIPAENIFLMSNGDVLTLGEDHGAVTDFVNAGSILIDGLGVGDIDADVLRERRLLAEDGLLSIVLTMDNKQQRLVGPAQIEMLGFIYEDDQDKVLKDLNEIIQRFAKEHKGDQLRLKLKQGKLKHDLKGLIRQKTKRSPIVLIHVVEV
ncbi:MAG: ribonuclease J [Eubacteriales bacterium]|nr:ribonuclease J [Eubacteriales bacterium]